MSPALLSSAGLFRLRTTRSEHPMLLEVDAESYRPVSDVAVSRSPCGEVRRGLCHICRDHSVGNTSGAGKYTAMPPPCGTRPQDGHVKQRLRVVLTVMAPVNPQDYGCLRICACYAYVKLPCPLLGGRVSLWSRHGIYPLLSHEHTSAPDCIHERSVVPCRAEMTLADAYIVHGKEGPSSHLEARFALLFCSLAKRTPQRGPRR
jgi:hypothetical protein